MPTYPYECPVCKHAFKVDQRMSDPPVSRCPECGQKPLRVFGVGLAVKGSSGSPSADAGCGAGDSGPAACPMRHSCGGGCSHA